MSGKVVTDIFPDLALEFSHHRRHRLDLIFLLAYCDRPLLADSSLIQQAQSDQKRTDPFLAEKRLYKAWQCLRNLGRFTG